MDEETLVEQAKEDPQAFAILYDRYVDRIYAYVFRQMQDPAAAQDVTAVTFEKALINIGRYRWQGKSFAAWLYRIARNETAQYYRRRKFLAPWTAFSQRQAVGNHPSPASHRDIESNLQQHERQQQLHSALTQLSTKDQEILSLRFFDELSSEEVARILGCSTANVYVRMHRALKRLRGILEKMESVNEVTYVG